MKQATPQHWTKLKTQRSRQVEKEFRKDFPKSDAYQYNSASIRVRVVDPRFKGRSFEQREKMIAPTLQRLPRDVQDDIINLVMLYPTETDDSMKQAMANAEFEDYTPSLL